MLNHNIEGILSAWYRGIRRSRRFRSSADNQLLYEGFVRQSAKTIILREIFNLKFQESAASDSSTKKRTYDSKISRHFFGALPEKTITYDL